jgi:hypothetical protein
MSCADFCGACTNDKLFNGPRTGSFVLRSCGVGKKEGGSEAIFFNIAIFFS